MVLVRIQEPRAVYETKKVRTTSVEVLVRVETPVEFTGRKRGSLVLQLVAGGYELALVAPRGEEQFGRSFPPQLIADPRKAVETYDQTLALWNITLLG